MPQFNVGDRVVMQNWADTNGIGLCNPINVEGVITDTEYDPSAWPYRVEWANGYSNCYKARHLRLASEVVCEKRGFAKWAASNLT